MIDEGGRLLTSVDDCNKWADYWRYDIGVNVVPADTKNKTIWITWSEWQDKPIPEELHKQIEVGKCFFQRHSDHPWNCMA